MTHTNMSLDGSPELLEKLRALQDVACPHGSTAVYCAACHAAYEKAEAWRAGVEKQIADLRDEIAVSQDQAGEEIRSLAAEMRRSFADAAADFAEIANQSGKQLRSAR